MGNKLTSTSISHAMFHYCVTSHNWIHMTNTQQSMRLWGKYCLFVELTQQCNYATLTELTGLASSALTLLVGRQEWHPACKKQWWGAGMVVCLERGADLHMTQLMQLSLTVSRFSKIPIGLTFPVLAYPGSPGKRTAKRTRACVCVCVEEAYS